MIDEQEVRERLAAVAVPATKLQVATLVESGRKRVLRRRAVLAGCGVVLATGLIVGVPSLLLRPGGPPPDQAAAVPTAPDPSGPRQWTADPGLPTLKCPATRLPVPAGMTTVQPGGVDPSGRYVLGNDVRSSELDTPEGKTAGIAAGQVILWTDGQPQVLPQVRDWVTASAVNADGVVAAIAGPRDEWADTVVRYTDGVPEKLTPPPGKWAFTEAKINATGDILVNADRAGSDHRTDAVLLWKTGSRTATRLPLPAYADGKGITDDGTIVGQVISGNGEKLTSYTWNQRGKGRALKAPAGQQATVSNVRNDWVTGNLWPSGEVGRWNLRTGEVTRLPVGSPANSINDKGWIASNGTVLRDDANVELGLADGVRGDPLAVSDTGVVVGLPFDGSSGVITWRCAG
jgi:hypothetical protein